MISRFKERMIFAEESMSKIKEVSNSKLIRLLKVISIRNQALLSLRILQEQ